LYQSIVVSPGRFGDSAGPAFLTFNARIIMDKVSLKSLSQFSFWVAEDVLMAQSPDDKGIVILPCNSRVTALYIAHRLNETLDNIGRLITSFRITEEY
jgi:hypothetical protein